LREIFGPARKARVSLLLIFFMLEMATDLLPHLRELEVALHQPKVRRNPIRLNQLLHDSFSEFARPGRCYSKAEILELLSQKFHRERFGPKTSQWQKSLRVLLYLPTNQRTSMQMVNLAAIR
jgi:hypothetical protein